MQHRHSCGAAVISAVQRIHNISQMQPGEFDHPVVRDALTGAGRALLDALPEAGCPAVTALTSRVRAMVARATVDPVQLRDLGVRLIDALQADLDEGQEHRLGVPPGPPQGHDPRSADPAAGASGTEHPRGQSP